MKHPENRPDAVTLIYEGHLPQMNRERPDWRRRWNLKQRALRQFGILPQRETRRAHLTITRILGPRERVMDEDNLRYAAKGAIDALPNRYRAPIGGKWLGGGNWIVDDSPAWITSEWHQDPARRSQGPRVEIRIAYYDPELNP